MAPSKRSHTTAFPCNDNESHAVKIARKGALAKNHTYETEFFPAHLAGKSAVVSHKIFHGLYVPTLTPLDRDGKLNCEHIPAYGKFLQEEGNNGVFVGGTAGMSMSLTTAERKTHLEAWVAFSKTTTKFEVIAHIMAQSVEDSRDLAAHAESLGVKGISAMTPCFFKPASVDLLGDYIAQIAVAAPNTPFLYYHFPDITGVVFPMTAVMADLHKKVPTLRGAKFTSTNMWDLGDSVDLSNELGKNWDLMMGFDGQTASALPLGVTSHIGIGFNIMSPTWNRMIQAFDKGDNKSCMKEQECARKWFAMFAKVVGLWNMGHACKIMIEDRIPGLYLGSVRAPQKKIPPQEVEALVVAWNDFKQQWGGEKMFAHEGVLVKKA